jgi:hypothetical protein
MQQECIGGVAYKVKSHENGVKRERTVFAELNLKGRYTPVLTKEGKELR